MHLSYVSKLCISAMYLSYVSKLRIYVFMYLCICVSKLCIYESLYLHIYVPMYQCVYPSLSLSFFLVISVYLPINLPSSIYLPIHLYITYLRLSISSSSVLPVFFPGGSVRFLKNTIFQKSSRQWVRVPGHDMGPGIKYHTKKGPDFFS